MSKRVLLVDDDKLMLRAIERRLGEELDIVLAQNAYEAISHLSNDESIGVVVTDISMPGMNGINFLNRLRIQWPDLACLVLSGNEDPKVGQQIAELSNVLAVFSKPTPTPELADAIRHHLNGATAAKAV